MKKVLFLLLLIIVCALQNASAQGWDWVKPGIGGLDEYGQSVVTDAAGNIYVCGTYNSANFTFGTMTLNNPGCPFSAIAACDIVYLLKCDPDGNLIWIRTAQGNGMATSVAIDNTGGVFIAGDFYSDSLIFGATTLVNDSMLTSNVFLAKYDSSGNVLWAKSAGGKMDDIATAVQSDRAGNAYMTGYFKSPAIAFGVTTFTNDSAGTGNIFVVKYNTNGNVVWARNAGGKMDDEATYLATDANGNSYVTGYFNSPSIIFGHDTLTNGGGKQNMFVVKFDSSGNVLWASDPGSNDNADPASISTDLYGGVYVTGYYWGYTCAFGGITLTNPDTASSGDTYNLFLVKYDSAGNIKWVRTATGDSYAQATTVTNDASGNVYIAGNTLSTNLVFGTDTLPDNDIFLAKYDSSGNVIWIANAHGLFADDVPDCITTDAFGNLYMSGDYSSWVMNFGTIILRDSNNLYMFLAKINTANTLVPIIKQTGNITVYPNPATTFLTISASQNITTISIINLLGQTVYSNKYNLSEVQIDVSGIPAGIYVLKVNGSEVRKFIKQ